jgi:hypothetical protein
LKIGLRWIMSIHPGNSSMSIEDSSLS